MKTGFSRTWRRAAAAVALPLMVAGCASAPGGAGADDRLVGTRWRFVAFESSDDAIGTRHPEATQAYVMELMPDGRVAMQLNCNRATGTWSSQATGGPYGEFSFGPLGVTRALCEPPSMDEEIARHAEFVRTYVLADDRLYLNLMADGGSLVWERDQ